MHDTETKIATAKMVVASTGAAISMDWLVGLVTIIFVVLQIGLLLPKYWKLWKSRGQRHAE